MQQGANYTDIEERRPVIAVSHRAHDLFEKAALTVCVWKAGVLAAQYRQPFDMFGACGRDSNFRGVPPTDR